MIGAMRTGLTLASLTLLAGLGLASCAIDNAPVGQPFTYNGNSWRVADNRGGDLTISVVDPRLAGLGTEAAARHRVDVLPPGEYRAAAMGWFTTTGRFCTPDDGTAADRGGYTYRYSCWQP